MKLQVEWGTPLQMKQAPRQNWIYKVDVDRLPVAPGVYVMGREWGEHFEALYVGKANSIRGRVKGQLNNLRLMQHLRNAKSGRRVLVYGELITGRGQQLDKCLPLVERALIRYFLSEGHDLVNIQGTLIRRHELISSHRPRRIGLPSPIYLEMSR